MARNAENQHSTRQDPMKKYTSCGARRGEHQREHSASAAGHQERIPRCAGRSRWRFCGDRSARF